MPIPALKKTVESGGSLPVEYSGSADTALKVLPDLAALTISPSSFLCSIYCLAYGMFAFAVTLALYPYLTDSDGDFTRRILLFILLALFVLLLWFGCKRQVSVIPQGYLAYQSEYWQLTRAGIRKDFRLSGEVLCWPWLIILPLSDVESGRRQTIVLAKDALSVADQARLRTWLRACLRPKA